MVLNKRALQQQLGLEQDDRKFMIGLVSRLTSQKGLDLIQCVMDDLCSDGIQFVVLGTGEEQYENMFRHYDWKYNNSVLNIIILSNICICFRIICIIINTVDNTMTLRNLHFSQEQHCPYFR